jgi:hypothetical protein
LLTFAKGRRSDQTIRKCIAGIHYRDSAEFALHVSKVRPEFDFSLPELSAV